MFVNIGVMRLLFTNWYEATKQQKYEENEVVSVAAHPTITGLEWQVYSVRLLCVFVHFMATITSMQRSVYVCMVAHRTEVNSRGKMSEEEDGLVKSGVVKFINLWLRWYNTTAESEGH